MSRVQKQSVCEQTRSALKRTGQQGYSRARYKIAKCEKGNCIDTTNCGSTQKTKIESNKRKVRLS